MPLRVLVSYGRPSVLDPRPDRPMSGIKTALLGLSSALARRGHEVHVFARCPAPRRHGGAEFHDRGGFARFTAGRAADVLIVIPEVLSLLMPVRVRARVVWTGNAFAGGDCALTAPWDWAPELGAAGRTARLYSMALLHPYADRVVAKSRWQAGHLARACGIPTGKFDVALQGVPLEFYDGPATLRHRHRLVYTSEARRGLGPLLRMFPEIRAAAPGAELHVFGYEYGGAGPADLPGADQPGVVWRGALAKSALAAELREAAVFAYPCTFKETFCTAAAEAQAAGLPVVTSDRAALAERVEDGVDGVLVRAKPGETPGYEAAFVAAVVRLLRDDRLWEAQSAAAAAKARRFYDWDAIAIGWEERLTRLIAGRAAAAPEVDPGLDLLDPDLLRVAERQAEAVVPPGRAAAWLREAWASYGYDPDGVPGLRGAGAPR